MANRERVQMLVDALRSGQYAQASNQLAYIGGDGGDRFCCLGVAMEIAIANGCPITYRDDDDPDRNGQATRFYLDAEGNNEETNVLTYAAMEWYGFHDTNPDLTVSREMNVKGRETASELNDSARWDFAKIADAFEATFLGPDDAAKD